MSAASADPRRALAISDEGRVRLARYLDCVLEASREVNLTSAAWDDREAARSALEAPSLAVGLAWSDRNPPGTAMDIGSGNGYPGIVIAAAWPDTRVLLVERRGKKAEAIRRCAEAAGFSNVEVHTADARDLAAHAEALAGAVDLVTARGVGSIADVTRLAVPFVAAGGRVVHWKASDLSDAELTEGMRVARARGLALVGEWHCTPVPPGPGRLLSFERQAAPA